MNLVERYVKMATPLTEAPRSFHYYLAYAVLSTALGRRLVYHGAGSFPMGPNIWLILLGPSSMAKKSTTLRIATDHVLREVFKDKPFKYPSEGSHESLIELMSERPQGLMTHAEFANLMSWLKRDYNNGLMGVLTDLYDQPHDYTRRVGTRDKAKTYTIASPFLNIVACSTLEWFNKQLDETTIMGGFLPRFMIVLDRSNGKLVPETPPPDQQLLTEIVMELQGYANIEPRKMVYSETARREFHAWYMEFSEKRIRKAPPMIVPFHARRMADLHKFAMMNAAMRDAGEMNSDDLDGAVSIVTQLCEYAEELISDKIALTPYQESRRKVLDLIEKYQNGVGGAPHSQVLKLARIRRNEFMDVIGSLAEENTIEVLSESTPGRKKVSYRINQGAQ